MSTLGHHPHHPRPDGAKPITGGRAAGDAPTTAKWLTHHGPAVVGVPAALIAGLPQWCLIVLVGLSALLGAAHVVVTQVIRLRASANVTASWDALRVLEIEDLPGSRQTR